MLLRSRPIISVYCEYYEEHLSIDSVHSAEFLVLKPGEANTNKKDVKFQGLLWSHAPGFL